MSTRGAIAGLAGAAGGMADGDIAKLQPVEPTRPTAFFGFVKLNGARVGRDARRIADGVIAQLAPLPGGDVEVPREVQGRVVEGVSEDVVRIASENATALKFDHASFEKG